MNTVCRHAAPFVAALLFVLGVTANAGHSADREDLRRILEENAARHRIQTRFPTECRRERQRSGGGGGSRAGSVSPGPVSNQTATVLLYGALAVFALIVAATLRDAAKNYQPATGRGKTRAAREDGLIVRRRMDAAGLEGDELAGRGDYIGAMHALLLRSLEEMRRRLGVSMAESMTSREILGHTRMDRESHAAFADIVHRVEVSYFGRHQPGKAEYDSCRASFTTLTRILGGGTT